MSGDPGQQYFSDGITEQIITSISKVPYISVIARQSSFAFRGKQMTVQQIARELGVRYILEGSLQRSGERLRINAQLINATSGHHIWADIYDRKLDDIFSMQDEICQNIMVALQVKLTEGEMAHLSADTLSIKAYEKYLKALGHYYRRTKEDALIARQLLQEAITIDPQYAAAYILIGWTYLYTKQYEKAISIWNDTLERNPDYLFAYYGLTAAYWLFGSKDQARQAAQQVLRINPKFSLDYWEKRSTIKDIEQKEQLFDAWRKAGLK
jgi:TolB-like protein